MNQSALRNFTLISFVIAFVGFVIVPFTSFNTYGSNFVSGKHWWSICLIMVPVGMLFAAAAVVVSHEVLAALAAAIAAVCLAAGIAGLIGFYREMSLIRFGETQIVEPYAGFWLTGLGIAILFGCSLIYVIRSWQEIDNF